MFTYYVYIISNYTRTVYYIGVTSNLQQRVLQHKSNEGGYFTSTYKCHFLMYFEEHANIQYAIDREKTLKKWKKEWKIILIRKENKTMEDLAASW